MILRQQPWEFPRDSHTAIFAIDRSDPMISRTPPPSWWSICASHVLLNCRKLVPAEEDSDTTTLVEHPRKLIPRKKNSSFCWGSREAVRALCEFSRIREGPREPRDSAVKAWDPRYRESTIRTWGLDENRYQYRGIRELSRNEILRIRKVLNTKIVAIYRIIRIEENQSSVNLNFQKSRNSRSFKGFKDLERPITKSLRKLAFSRIRRIRGLQIAMIEDSRTLKIYEALVEGDEIATYLWSRLSQDSRYPGSSFSGFY